MQQLYPEIEPYKHGMIDGGDNNLIYWEACGNKHGKPALVLHGGPGSGCSATMRRFFHPGLYNIILFDQRGCGRSTPHAGDLTTNLETNTTWHLLADIEKLREHLSIAKWLILGFSWGSTLGLAYTEYHPDNVSELILVGVTMTRTSEINWLYRDVAPLFPEQWMQFRAYAHKAESKSDDLVAAYYHLLHDPNQDIALEAAKAWHAWEAASLSIDANAQLPPQWNEPDFLLARARIVTHYFHHKAWLEDDILLKNATQLSGIPGVMVQARLDLAFDTLEKLDTALQQAGFTDIQVHMEERDYVYPTDEEWWLSLWSHGVRSRFEQLEALALATFKADMIRKVQVMKQPDGIHTVWHALFALAQKPS